MSVEENRQNTIKPYHAGQDAVMRLLEQGVAKRNQATKELEDIDEVIQFYRGHSIDTNEFFELSAAIEAYRNSTEACIQYSTPAEAKNVVRVAIGNIQRMHRMIASKSSETRRSDGSHRLSLTQDLLRQKQEIFTRNENVDSQKRGLAAMMGNRSDT